MILTKELDDLEAGISEYQEFPDYYIKKIRRILDKLDRDIWKWEGTR